jgi:hypothetical protein
VLTILVNLGVVTQAQNDAKKYKFFWLHKILINL